MVQADTACVAGAVRDPLRRHGRGVRARALDLSCARSRPSRLTKHACFNGTQTNNWEQLKVHTRGTRCAPPTQMACAT
jgi:hypothetical protein